MTKFFLSYVRPHNPVSSSSIAKWILSTLQSAGIDATTFKAHSVRSASASAAASAGITTNQILEAADWSSESAFQRFYYKLCNSNRVGTAVLSTGSTDSLQKSHWYVIRAFWSVITWMAQITEWLPAILDYMRNVRWTYQHPIPPNLLSYNRYPGTETLISHHKQWLYFNNTIYINLLTSCSQLVKRRIIVCTWSLIWGCHCAPIG